MSDSLEAFRHCRETMNAAIAEAGRRAVARLEEFPVT